jgi:hypothetical protein
MSGFKTFQRVLGLLILFSGICPGLNGQSRQVPITRDYVDSTAVHKGSIIHINSQKANISIRGWNRSTIVVRIKITFEHADGNLARKELEYAKFNVLRTSEGMVANNYFSLPAGISKISSKVRVEYTVNVPNDVNLVVNNTYGSCEISNLKTFINLNNKYGEVRMSDVSGLIRIYTTLCKVTADNLGGEVSFTGLNSDFHLGNVNGQVKIINNVGNLEVSPGESLIALTINAAHSEVILHIKDIDRYGFSLAAKSAAVILPQDFYKHKFKERTESKAISAMVAGKTLITVNTSFNNINLK